MNKSILIAALLYSTGTVLGATEANDNAQKTFTGGYLGAGIGYNKDKNKNKVETAKVETKININSVGANLFAGYLYQFQNNFTVGIEASCTSISVALKQNVKKYLR